eukprot:scaffold421101_cov32-Attheya_sp.AAC.1
MFFLAALYGWMNILSFVALQNIGAGVFTIFAQCKILTTATFSTLLLGQKYSAGKWRALVGLMLGVLMFSEPIWNNVNTFESELEGNQMLGTGAVILEVIKTDKEQLGIWERNFQLALGAQVVINICNYTFDATPNESVVPPKGDPERI